MSRDESAEAGATREQVRLVAYLDGALTAEEAAPVADSLRRDPGVRAEADELRRVWELLEVLPVTRRSDDLSSRTLAAIREVDATSGRSKFASVMSWLLFVAVIATAAALGRGWTRRPAPVDDRLARERTLAENLEGYRAAGSLEFLRGLERSGAFAESEP